MVSYLCDTHGITVRAYVLFQCDKSSPDNDCN